MTDANGNKLDDCDFLPFGQTLCQTSSSGNHYLYTGLERDADQLDHTLHRQYSSSLGRWMSPDPGGVKVVNLANPQTWNMYAYVTDNPTTFNDPTGLDKGVPNSPPAAADGDGCSSPVGTNTTQTCGTVQTQTGGLKYLQKTFQKIFGQKATAISNLGPHNGHDNEEITTHDTSKFEKILKSHGVITPRGTARFNVKINGKSYNLHVEFPKRAHGLVSVRAHFDVGNPSRDLFGAFKHFAVDMLWGKAEYPNSDGLDPQ